MRGHIAKKGKYYYIVVDIRDEYGKRKRKWLSGPDGKGFSRKKDAEQAMPDIINQLHDGTFREPTGDTLAEIMDDWLEDKKSSVRFGTWRAYDWLIQRHFIPHLGKIRAVELEAKQLHTLYHKKLLPVLAVTTIKKLHVIIVQALDRLVTWGELPRNVAKGVELPKRGKKVKFEVWTEEQLDLFLEYAKSDPYFEIFELAASTGMRQSEILGLPRSELDLDLKKLSIRQAYVKAEKGHDFDDPKSEAGERSVALFDDTVNYLRAYLQRQEEHRKQLEEIGRKRTPPVKLYDDHGLVFQTSVGTPIGPRNLMRNYYRILGKIEEDLEEKKAKGEQVIEFKRIPFKDLRHTHATILLKNGWHPKIVQERLGHSSVQVTLDIYSHVIPDMQAAMIGSFGPSITRRKNEPIKPL